MTIEQRLDRLEQQNRILKGAGAAVVLAVMGVAVMGAGQQGTIPDVVKARSFEVIGKDGIPRVIIATLALADGEVGKIVTLNSKMSVIVDLAATDSGGGLIVTGNGNGKDLVTLGVATGGEGTVTTRNGSGKVLVNLGVSTEGLGLVTAYDPSGRHGFGRLEPRN